MATNTDIWGAKADWACPSTAFSGSNVDMKPLIGHFGTPPSSGYTQGDLYVGLSNGVFPSSNGFTNEPIDTSISYCGLGSNSVWSHIEYYMVGEHSTVSNLVNTDERSITNFAFCYRQSSSYSGLYQTNDTTSNSKLGNRCRWSPYGVNLLTLNPSAADTNRNRQVCPYVQLPVRNFVLVPYVRAASSLNENSGSTSGMDLTNFVWWDYIDTTKPKNKTTHPYILSITFQPYTVTTHADDIDADTGKPNTGDSRVVLSIYSGISILSPVSYAKGAETDIANPTGTPLGDVYSYYFSRTRSGGSALSGITIFGTSSVGLNDFDYISQTSNPTPSLQLRWLLRHPNAVLRNMANTANYGWYYLEYYDGLEEWIMHQIACFGLFFTLDKATAETGALNDEKMYLGVLENGVGNGQYVHGEQNENQEQWNWDTTNDSTYRPHEGGGEEGDDDNTYGRTWGFNPVSLADSTIRRYIMSDAELANLGEYLWDIIDTSDPTALIQNQTLTNFLTNNPLDCVVSLKRFPFDNMSQGSLTNLVLGKVTVPNVAGKPFTADSVTRSCGTKHIFHRFHDWRDYICQYFLYLPFCGTLQLDAETVVGRDIAVYYAIDYTTGTCTAYVTTWDDDGAECYIDSASGNCSIDVPLSGVETATLTGEIYNANENLKALKFNAIVGGTKSAMNFVSKVGSGDKMQSMLSGLDLGTDIVNAIHSANQAEWNINNTQIPLKMIGASSGCNSFQAELTPCLLIYYPETIDDFNEANYAHSVGLQCCESGLIGDYSGYAEITNADLSGFTATATEKNMIQNALSGGIYL